jgi:hypothetical protein
VRLGERGRRGRPGAGRGESLFSLICIEISNKRFRELSVVSFMHPQHPCKYSRNINNALGPSPRGWGRNPMKESAAMTTPGSSTLFVPGDKSYAGQGAGRADRNRRPYLKNLALQRRRGQAAGCVAYSDILARIPHRSLEDPEGWIRCHSAETGAWMRTNRG